MLTEEKREALKSLVYGVYVVGTSVGDAVHGFTASWVSQVSSDPPMVMVAIARSNKAHEYIRQTGNFSVSVLTAEQEDLAKRFAGDPEAGGESADLFRTREGNAPVLKDCKAYMECVLIEVLSAGGNHDLFLGSVADAGEPGSGDPMVLHQSGLGYWGV